MNRKDWSDFECYLIKRIDTLDDKLNKLSLKVNKNTIITSGITSVLVVLLAQLIRRI